LRGLFTRLEIGRIFIGIFFEGVNIANLKKQVAPFLAMTLGGPNEYRGAGLEQSHARLVAMGLDEGVLDAFLGHFEDVLRGLGVPAAKIAEVMPIFQGARAAVLNR